MYIGVYIRFGREYYNVELHIAEGHVMLLCIYDREILRRGLNIIALSCYNRHSILSHSEYRVTNAQ